MADPTVGDPYTNPFTREDDDTLLCVKVGKQNTHTERLKHALQICSQCMELFLSKAVAESGFSHTHFVSLIRSACLHGILLHYRTAELLGA